VILVLVLVVAVIALVLVLRRAHLTTAALVTIMAIILSGAAAGAIVSPVFYATTVLLAGLLVRAESNAQGMTSRAKPRSISDLPPALQATVTAALNALPEGEARRQLLGLIADARPLYAARSTRFDESEEREQSGDVNDLIEACCETALELNTIDSVVSATPARAPRAAGAAATPSSEVNARLASAREVLVGRLKDARTAIKTLYLADVEQGTSASQRVAELAAEIKSDAAARRAAIADIDTLLR
jgi:hypothetical protein